jgi:large repetitive protein
MADGSISGTITNVLNGATLEGVSVALVNTKTEQKSTTQTDSDGNFSFSSVASGSYNLTATKDGFSTYAYDGIGPTMTGIKISMTKKGVAF